LKKRTKVQIREKDTGSEEGGKKNWLRHPEPRKNKKNKKCATPENVKKNIFEERNAGPRGKHRTVGLMTKTIKAGRIGEGNDKAEKKAKLTGVRTGNGKSRKKKKKGKGSRASA